jgi:hypothetical protein
VAGNREQVPPATTIRSCRVTVTTADDVIHMVEVQASRIFDAAASGVARFRDEGWIDTLGPDAVIRVEVQLPPVVHDVPVQALKRWASGPGIGPKQELLKRPLRGSRARHLSGLSRRG